MAIKHLKSMVLAFALSAGAGTADLVQAQQVAGSYLAARQAGYQHDFEAAARYFAMALTRDPSNPALMENATLAYLSLGDLDRAALIGAQMEAAGLTSQIAQMAVVAHEAQGGEYAAIVDRLAADKGVGPLVDGLLKGWVLMGQGAVAEALEAFDAVAEERGLEAFAGYHKALALASVGDFEGAADIFAGDSAGPLQMTRRGVMAQLEILSQLDRQDDALAMLEELFAGDLDPGLTAMQAALQAGDRLPFTHVQGPKDGIAELFYSVAAALSNEANDDYTLLYSRIATYLRPDHVDAILLSASLLDDMQRYDLAVATYKLVPPGDPAFHAAELGRAEALRRTDRIEAAAEVLDQLTRSHGDLPIVHTSLGDLRRQQKDFAGAVKAYDAALALYDAGAQAEWFIYYARAISYERLDKWDAAEADFRKALELSPDQPQVLNYLGYSLVEKGAKLDEALEMIERAVAVQPRSGYIIDSLGWALYRLGRYDEAVVHMERAAELMPVDPVVNDHLGDSLWAVGREMEARFQWRRALSFANDENASGEVDIERLRAKLDVGLDVVLAAEGAAPLKGDDQVADKASDDSN